MVRNCTGGPRTLLDIQGISQHRLEVAKSRSLAVISQVGAGRHGAITLISGPTPLPGSSFSPLGATKWWPRAVKRLGMVKPAALLHAEGHAQGQRERLFDCTIATN